MPCVVNVWDKRCNCKHTPTSVLIYTYRLPLCCSRALRDQAMAGSSFIWLLCYSLCAAVLQVGPPDLEARQVVCSFRPVGAASAGDHVCQLFCVGFRHGNQLVQMSEE